MRTATRRRAARIVIAVDLLGLIVIVLLAGTHGHHYWGVLAGACAMAVVSIVSSSFYLRWSRR